jgi:hypothetical protein
MHSPAALQRSSAPQTGLHSDTHCPSWHVKPLRQLGKQAAALATGGAAAGAGVTPAGPGTLGDAALWASAEPPVVSTHNAPVHRTRLRHMGGIKY